MKATEKLSKYLCILFMIMGMTLSFSACSSDDDKNSPEETEDILQEGKWTVDGNTYTYTIKQDYGYVAWSMKWIVTFDNSDKCISSKCENIFSDKEIAQAFYEEYKLTEEEPVTISGKTVIIDYSNTHKGILKSDLLALIEAMGDVL